MNKNPYTSMKFDNTPYEKAKVDTEAKINNIYDAEIGTVSNQQALASSVQGVGNIGRVSADTAAKVYGQRDQRVANNFAEISQQKMASEAGFNREKQNLINEWEANKPNAWDYITSAMPLVSGGLNIMNSFGIFDKMLGGGKKAQAGTALNYGGVIPPKFDMTTNQTDNTTITPPPMNTGANDIKYMDTNFGTNKFLNTNYKLKNLGKMPFSFKKPQLTF